MLITADNPVFVGNVVDIEKLAIGKELERLQPLSSLLSN